MVNKTIWRFTRSQTSFRQGCIVAEVTLEAFKSLEISNHTEQFIIAELRRSKALTLSLVAEADGRVIGHIAFSPLGISEGTPSWYGLGPVSVLPEYQRQGIGKALITEGLEKAEGHACRRVLPCRASRVLPSVRIRQHAKAQPSGCAAGSLFYAFI
nr:N-acetyltransferase [Pelodictyon luteolum]